MRSPVDAPAEILLAVFALLLAALVVVA